MQALKQLEAGIISDATVTKLVDVFALLAPDAFTERKLKSAVVFPHPDRQWAENLVAIRSRFTTALHNIVIRTDETKVQIAADGETTAFTVPLDSTRSGDNQNDEITGLHALNIDMDVSEILDGDQDGQAFPHEYNEQKALFEDEERISGQFLGNILAASRRNRV